jgi:hypothetical protein
MRRDACLVVVGKCNHKFHQHCMSSWVRMGNAYCPLCKDAWDQDAWDH